MDQIVLMSAVGAVGYLLYRFLKPGPSSPEKLDNHLSKQQDKIKAAIESLDKQLEDLKNKKDHRDTKEVEDYYVKKD